MKHSPETERDASNMKENMGSDPIGEVSFSFKFNVFEPMMDTTYTITDTTSIKYSPGPGPVQYQ